ncbi:hypothetical protein [Paenibacillus xylaniclasticus]|uniref:hypothetical protein n=1 Tax=Paenibacillus xylaniclasticus TaxID=588083 RepID=UPI000FDB52D1|nr:MULTISPECIES: hypothetical protein [Paenibacillus]GFN29779.1 hypothetical protein PCURB6_00390 [Paenibacillus curdlanolyticus]
MNKPLLYILFLVAVLLSGCSSGSSWEEEQLEEVSDRLLADDVTAVWTVKPDLESSDDPNGDIPATIQLTLKKQDGTPIESFDLNHEKLVHLIVISRDLSYFNHIHPEYAGEGRFEIQNTFPAGGEYKLIADFKPSDGDSMTTMEWVTLQGLSAPSKPVVPDRSLMKTEEGVNVQLDIDNPGVNENTVLTFTLTESSGGEPITDLQPYLGAIGHVVIVSEDGERYIHVHAEEGQESGPKAVFETSFPSSGVYKIWAQFQRSDRVFTVPFVIEAEAAS